MSIFKYMADIFDQFFSGIERDLLIINSKESPSRYIYKAKIYSIGISVSVSIFTFFSLLMYNIKVYGSVNPTFPIIFGTVAGILGFFGFLLLFKKYPSIKKQNRARKIDNSLYYAVLYMASLVSSGATPKALFELLSKYSEFSEIKKEASEIIYLIDTVGLSLPVALERKAEYSPSKKWASILNGMKSIIVEGGNIEEYLYNEASKLFDEYKRKVIEYSNNMQVFLEIYITLIIVGVIFVIILTTLMGSISGTNFQYIEFIQLMSILIILPMGTVMFIILLKSISPFET